MRACPLSPPDWPGAKAAPGHGRAIVRSGREEDPVDNQDPRYWEVFFEVHSGLPREAPGDAASTRQALGRMPLLPREPLILDLGCGPGAATTLLARETGGRVVGVDLHLPFLRDLRRKAQGLGSRVHVVHANMESLPFAPATFDLVWSEGALYSIGFPRGLETAHAVLKPDGHLAATEAVWLEADPPDEVRRWWESEYPDIGSVDANLALIAEAGFVTLDHFTLPSRAWREYYDPLEAKLEGLRRRHADDAVALGVLDEARVEADMYRRYGASYGYEFFVCRRA